MKKLLAVTAMAALVAGAAFAAPSFSISATADADLFNLDADTDAKKNVMNVLTDPAVKGSPSTNWKTSVAGEKAGASITTGDGKGAHFWFKPVDMLTLSLDSGNYGASLNIDAFTVDVTIPGTVFTYNSKPDATEKEIDYAKNQVVKVSYKAAGFGETYVQYTNIYDADVDGKTGIAAIEQYYKNTFAPVTVENKVNVDITKNGAKSDEAISDSLTLSTKIGNVDVSVNNVYGINIIADVKKPTMNDSTKVTVTVPVSNMEAKFEVSEENWMAIKDSTLSASATLSGKYEVLGWHVGLTCDAVGIKDEDGNLTNHGVKIAVPFGFSANF